MLTRKKSTLLEKPVGLLGYAALLDRSDVSQITREIKKTSKVVKRLPSSFESITPLVIHAVI